MKNKMISYERPFKMKKDGVSLFLISFLIPKKFTKKVSGKDNAYYLRESLVKRPYSRGRGEGEKISNHVLKHC